MQIFLILINKIISKRIVFIFFSLILVFKLSAQGPSWLQVRVSHVEPFFITSDSVLSKYRVMIDKDYLPVHIDSIEAIKAEVTITYVATLVDSTREFLVIDYWDEVTGLEVHGIFIDLIIRHYDYSDYDVFSSRAWIKVK